MSGYVRRILAEPPDITKEQYEHLKTDFIYEIRKIGVNINQIAKKYNEYAYTEPSKDLMDKMERISDLARTVTKSIEGREG